MKENLKTICKLLDDFNNFMDNRPITFLAMSKEVFPRILQWHFRIWREEQSYLSEDERVKEWSSFDEIGRILDSAILRIEDRTLREKRIGAFSFFKYLKKHLANHETEYVVVNNDKRYYAQALLSTFYQLFFETIADSPARHEIWKHYFPKEWKVTKGNFQQSILCRVSWGEFQGWALDRIWPPKEKPDKKLDEVLANLFPETEPTVWSRILIFVFSPDGEKRLQSAIQHPWNFGSILPRCSISRGFARLAEESEKQFFRRIGEIKQAQTEEEIRNTFEFACFLFTDEFSKEKLENYQRELEGIKCVENSIGEHHRLDLLNIFSQMLEFLNQKTAQSEPPPPVESA